MRKPQNLFLIGPMGAGKSAVGRQLARTLHLNFMDSDDEIEARTGVDISFIFEKEGEEGFRKREAKVIDDLSKIEGLVLATGGGAVQDAQSRSFLGARGFVVYLYTTVDQQLARTQKGRERPLLESGDRKQILEDLMQERDELYREVADLIVDGERVSGVVTGMGLKFHAATVVLTVGTFLGGRIHVGSRNYAGGRAGDPPANALAARLRELPLGVERLKTGTPPRLDGRSIDYSQLQAQPGDQPLPVMSFLGSVADHPRQVDCHITRTNARTHEIIASGLHDSPMYSGAIAGTGALFLVGA